MSGNRLGTSQGPFFIEEGLETNRSTGGSGFQVWEGSVAECSSKRLELLARGASKAVINSTGTGDYRVRAEWAYDFQTVNAESFVDTLELETNLVQRSVYQSPVYRKRFSDYDPVTGYSAKANATIPVIQKAFQILTSLQPTIDKTTVSGTTTITVRKPSYMWDGVSYPTAELAANAYGYAQLLKIPGLTGGEADSASNLFIEVAHMGVTSFWEFGTVFRRTVTAGNPGAVQSNFAGVGMIWTSDEVSAFEGIPTSGAYFNLPAGKQWIKDKPRVLKSYNQKTQLSYNYTEIVSASALLYEAYGTAQLIHT